MEKTFEEQLIEAVKKRIDIINSDIEYEYTSDRRRRELENMMVFLETLKGCFEP